MRITRQKFENYECAIRVAGEGNCDIDLICELGNLTKREYHKIKNNYVKYEKRYPEKN